jgi:hypothetical protein
MSAGERQAEDENANTPRQTHVSAKPSDPSDASSAPPSTPSPAVKRNSLSGSAAARAAAAAPGGHDGGGHADTPQTSSTATVPATAGIQVVPVQPSTFLGSYVRPRGSSRPMTPASQVPKPLSLVDKEQIEGLVSVAALLCAARK